MKRVLIISLVCVAWLIPAFVWGMCVGRKEIDTSQYEMGRLQGREERLDIWFRADDPNYDSRFDPNHIDYTNPNDPWRFDSPENPVIYINEDTFRLHPGSSIKYVEIGDPCVIVSYIEPQATGGGIDIDVNDPNLYSGFIIYNCSFDMTDPDCDGSNWYCNRCKYPPSSLSDHIADINGIKFVDWGDSLVIENCFFEVNDPNARIKW